MALRPSSSPRRPPTTPDRPAIPAASMAAHTWAMSAGRARRNRRCPLRTRRMATSTRSPPTASRPRPCTIPTPTSGGRRAPSPMRITRRVHAWLTMSGARRRCSNRRNESANRRDDGLGERSRHLTASHHGDPGASFCFSLFLLTAPKIASLCFALPRILYL